VLVLQLIDAEVLTVEQAEQVFDGAAKRSARLKDVAPDAERVIQHLHDELNWDITNWRLTAGDIAKRGTDLNATETQSVIERGLRRCGA